MKKAYAGLGAIPAGSENLGGGEHLLPTTMSNELLAEPVEENSLRQVEPVSQIPGLEEPKIDFTIEDADLADVTDEETAREIKMEGDTISYGRFKTKIVVTVKDTVLHGTDTDLVNKVEAAPALRPCHQGEDQRLPRCLRHQARPYVLLSEQHQGSRGR